MAELPPGVDRDTPLRLQRAVELAYPQGGMTVSGLRQEARRGRLAIERVAGKDFTTLADIDRMRALCRPVQKVPASGCEKQEPTNPAPSAPLSGSSAMVDATAPRAALHVILTELGGRSNGTSPKSTPVRHRKPATVIPLQSRLQTF